MAAAADVVLGMTPSRLLKAQDGTQATSLVPAGPLQPGRHLCLLELVEALYLLFASMPFQ